MTDTVKRPIANAARKSLQAQKTAAAALAVLLLNSLLQQFTEADARFSLLLLQWLPLLLFVPGMWTRQHRSYSWLCFVVLFYFIVAVTNVMSPLASLHGWIMLIASVVLFNAAMLASRWMQHAAWAERLAHSAGHGAEESTEQGTQQ